MTFDDADDNVYADFYMKKKNLFEGTIKNLIKAKGIEIIEVKTPVFIDEEGIARAIKSWADVSEQSIIDTIDELGPFSKFYFMGLEGAFGWDERNAIHRSIWLLRGLFV